MKAAAELMDSADKPVLRVVIDNMIYPITLEVIHKVAILNLLCYIIPFMLLLLLNCKDT